MPTSKTYQQSLADASSETRPPMLERGPYQFEMFIPNNSTVLKLQTAEDLQGDALLHYDAEHWSSELISSSIPMTFYNSVDACTSAKDMWKRVERLMRGTYTNQVDRENCFTKQTYHPYYVTHPTSVVDYEDEYQQDDVHTNSEDPLASAMLLLARAITQNFSTPTNNRLRTSSNTRNQAIIQGDRVNIQSRNSGNAGRNNRRAYVQEEIVEGSNAPNETENVQRTLRTSSSGNTSTVQCYNYSGKGHYARNYPKPRVQDSKYFMEQMLLAKQDEKLEVILPNEQMIFDFLKASRMEEIEELSANICLMARIQPADNTSDVGPSYDSAFISEVQSSSNTENEEQMYPTHTKIINSTIGDDQIDSDIIFDSPNRNVNSGSIEKDTHVPDLCNSEISLNVKDNEDTLDDASKSQQKVYKKMNDPIAVANSYRINPHAKIFYIRKQKEPGKPKEEVYSNSKIIQVIKTYRELGYEHKFVIEIVARRANECIVLITEPDYKNLNKNDIKDMYLLIMNGKVPRLCRNRVVMVFISIQQKFSDMGKSAWNHIKNSKKEKRVMTHSEIHKFYDATLNRALEGLKSYNNDVIVMAMYKENSQ
ncbi:hypothetical protein Tco_0901793 [Tanacetum coccineum]